MKQRHVMKLPAIVLIAVSFGGVLISASAARLITYPAPAGEAPSVDYELEVEGRAVAVYTARTLDPPFAGKQWDYGGPYSFANFDLDGRVVARVKSKRTLDKAVIRPAQARVQVTRENEHTLRLVIDGPCKFSLEGAPGEYFVQLEGADAEHNVQQVLFQNVTVNGQPLRENSPRLRIGQNVQQVRFSTSR